VTFLKRLYQSICYRFVKTTFRFWERLGFHFTLNHYYSPIPDTGSLPTSLWSRHTQLPGLELNLDEQMHRLTLFKEQYGAEYDQLPIKATADPSRFYMDNGYFGNVDAEIYYSMIRHYKPMHVLEVGAGHSTLLASQALSVNKTRDPAYVYELLAIEPYPRRELLSHVKGLTQLIEQPIQDVPLDYFSRLKANDILFIDSSHIVKIGSDLQVELLEILPRLNEGVFIHFHDIFTPAEYPQSAIQQDHAFYNEQYFLQAFMAFNSHFKVIWANSYLHLNHKELLEQSFSSYRTMHRWPASFWIQKIL